jgi:hypothetical protein
MSAVITSLIVAIAFGFASFISFSNMLRNVETRNYIWSAWWLIICISYNLLVVAFLATTMILCLAI